jgi:FAD/FMN-containing dehydrogenase
VARAAPAYFAALAGASRAARASSPTSACRSRRWPIASRRPAATSTSEGLRRSLGHVGDGNFHVIFLPMPDAPAEQQAVDRVYDALLRRARELGGTCTGEHGIGMGKKDTLLEQYGPDVVELMRLTKLAWDPTSLLNPGKIF